MPIWLENKEAAAARAVLTEILYLHGAVRAGTLSGDCFLVAVVRASGPWLSHWAFCFENALRAAERRAERESAARGAVAVSSGEPEEAEPGPADTEPETEAETDAQAIIARTKTLLRRALCNSETLWFRKADRFDCTSMTRNLLLFYDSLERAKAGDAAPEG